MAKLPPRQGSNRTGIKSGPNAKKTGPAPKEIDWKTVSKLASFFCTTQEICQIIEVSDETLSTRCRKENRISLSEFIDASRGKGKMALRRAQFQAAIEKGNVQMQIWLGKQLLGQTDKIIHDTSNVPQLTLNYADPSKHDKVKNKSDN